MNPDIYQCKTSDSEPDAKESWVTVSEKSITRSLEYAESIIDTVREPLIVLNQDLRVVSASRSFYEIFKAKPEKTVGQLLFDLGDRQWDIPRLRELLETILLQRTSFDNYEVEHVFPTIGRRVMLLNARQIVRRRGKERIILLAIEDITARKEREEELHRIAYHDGLTDLPNRMLLLDHLNMAINQADRNRMRVALMMLDLDKFKEVNDSLDHQIGDKLLRAIGKKLTEILPKADTVARFGGDEFALVLPEQKDDKTTLRVAAKIIEAFRNPVILDGHSLSITCSIGISLYPDHGADIDTNSEKRRHRHVSGQAYGTESIPALHGRKACQEKMIPR